MKINDKKYYIDVFIPVKNIAIEYNGDYWHCNPEKYSSEYFHKKKIIAGYSPSLVIPERTHDYIYGVYSVGYVMGRLSNPEKIKFKNIREV